MCGFLSQSDGTVLRNSICNSVYCLSPELFCQIPFLTELHFGMHAFHSAYPYGDIRGVSKKSSRIFEGLLH